MTESTGAGVLVVDDNASNAELLCAYLEELGWPVRVASGGDAGLKMAQETPPDVILLDVMMPKISGYEVCEALRGDDRTKDIPIVMVTALNAVSDVERAAEVGADDFLTKPVRKSELLLRVRAMAKLASLRKRVAELEGR